MSTYWHTPLLELVSFRYNHVNFTFKNNDPREIGASCTSWIPNLVEGEDHVYNNAYTIKKADMSVIISAIKKAKLTALLTGEEHNETILYGISHPTGRMHSGTVPNS